ncbi:zinc-ribbon domain-containing protein [Lacticaseibacillus sp. GG6-2]
MKFCGNCGAALAPGAKFCTQCGAAVPVSEQTPAAEPVSLEMPKPQPARSVAVPLVTQVKGMNRKRLWLMIAGAVVVVLAGFGWWYTHQLFNLSKTAYRVNTVYALKDIASEDVSGTTAQSAKTEVVYLQFSPDGRVYSYTYGDDGYGDYTGYSQAGRYTLNKGVMHLTFDKDEYYADADTVAELHSPNLDEDNVDDEEVDASAREIEMTVDHEQLTKLAMSFGSAEGSVSLKTPAQPTKQKLAAINPQAIYERWVQLDKD